MITLYPFSLDRLWELCGDPAFAEERCLASGAQAVTIRRFLATPARIELELDHDGALGPGFRPPWIRDECTSLQTLRERAEWRRTGPRRADMKLAIHPVGAPARIDARCHAWEPAPGLTFTLTAWRVTSTLPHLAEEVERCFSDRIAARLRHERRFTLQYVNDMARGRAARPHGIVDTVLRRT
jgi:hypothetical protein